MIKRFTILVKQGFSDIKKSPLDSFHRSDQLDHTVTVKDQNYTYWCFNLLQPTSHATWRESIKI